MQKKKKNLITPYRVFLAVSVLWLIFIFKTIDEDVKLLFLKNGNWEPIHGLPGRVTSFLTDSNNLWVKTKSKDGISHFDGQSWKHFVYTDFTDSIDRVVSYTAANGSLWIATEKADVFKFDGTELVKYEGALKDHERVKLAASGNKFWAISKNGVLSAYDGATWTEEDLKGSIPTLDWGSARRIQIYPSSDGSLWLQADGIWRYNSGQWSNALTSTELVTPTILGVSDGKLWLKENFNRLQWSRRSEGERLGWIAQDGSSFDIITANDIGVDPTNDIYAFVTASGSVQAYVDGQLFTLRNSAWDVSPSILPLPDDFIRLKKLKPYTQNTLVASAEVNQGIISKLRDYDLIIMLSLIVLLMACLWWMIIYDREKKKEEAEFLKETTGVSVAGDHIIVEGEKIDVEEGLSRNGVITEILLGLVLMPIFFAPARYGVAYFDKLIDFISGNSVIGAVICYSLIILAAVCLSSWLVTLPWKFIFAPLRRGCDYEKAVERAKGMHKIGRTGADELHGIVLMWAGRFDEAERVLKRYLAEKAAKKNYIGSGQLSTLIAAYGRILCWSGKYNAAIDEYQRALKIDDTRYETQLGLAEVYLEQRENLGQARQLLDKAISIRYGLNSILDRIFIPEDALRLHSANALCLALESKITEAHAAIKTALKKGGKKPAPEVALVYYRAGQICEIEHDMRKAHENYQQAASVDPNGYMGKKAKERLSKL